MRMSLRERIGMGMRRKKEEDEGERRKENVKGRDVVVVMKLEEDEE